MLLLCVWRAPVVTPAPRLSCRIVLGIRSAAAETAAAASSSTTAASSSSAAVTETAASSAAAAAAAHGDEEGGGLRKGGEDIPRRGEPFNQPAHCHLRCVGCFAHE